MKFEVTVHPAGGLRPREELSTRADVLGPCLVEESSRVPIAGDDETTCGRNVSAKEIERKVAVVNALSTRKPDVFDVEVLEPSARGLVVARVHTGDDDRSD